MAGSKCGSCGGFNFEIKLTEPSGAKFKQYFIQCSACGVPVGVIEYTSAGVLIESLAKKVGTVQTQLMALSDIDDRLRRVEKALKGLHS